MQPSYYNPAGQMHWSPQSTGGPLPQGPARAAGFPRSYSTTSPGGPLLRGGSATPYPQQPPSNPWSMGGDCEKMLRGHNFPRSQSNVHFQPQLEVHAPMPPSSPSRKYPAGSMPQDDRVTFQKWTHQPILESGSSMQRLHGPRTPAQSEAQVQQPMNVAGRSPLQQLGYQAGHSDAEIIVMIWNEIGRLQLELEDAGPGASLAWLRDMFVDEDILYERKEGLKRQIETLANELEHIKHCNGAHIPSGILPTSQPLADYHAQRLAQATERFEGLMR